MSHPDRLSQWETEVSTAFPHLSHPQRWGLVRMSARVSRCLDVPELCRSVLYWRWCWDKENKRSDHALTRVVSGCQAKKWKKAPRTGCDDVFCSLTPMGFTLVEKRDQASGTGHRCHHVGQSVDDPGGKPGGEKLCHSRGVESLASRAGRILASVLGRVAQFLARGGPSRVAGAGARRPGLVCALALECDPGMWLASLFADQSGRQGAPGRRTKL